MTISTWLMILAFAAGTWTAQSNESMSTSAEAPRHRGIAGECYINGQWYNPCTDTTFPNPDGDPLNQQP